MKLDQLKTLFREFDENLRFEYDLKKKNWFNIGGKTKVFFKANNLHELIKFLKIVNNQEKIFILGAGSNTLISDDLFDGIVIKLGKNFNNISLLGDDVIIAGSAVTIITIPSKEIKFEYRKSNLSDDLIFLSASFKGSKSSSSQIKNEIENLVKKKEKAQPTRIKTSGSTFKNPKSQTNKKVWELIKESVPLDKSFGDACISEKHCNFFVNKGSASFNDMNNLIEFVSKEVLEKTGIKLEKEIKILK